MSIRNYILFAVLITALAACKENELPQPVKENPKIWVQFTVNGATYKFTAGENNTVVKATSNILNSKRDFIFSIDAPQFNKALEISIFNLPQNVINQSFDNVESELDRTIKKGLYKYSFNDGFMAWYPKQGEMSLKFTDKWYGEVYETLASHQSSSSYFEIISVTDTEYEGRPYKLAEIKFSCYVKCHATNGYYKITNGKGVVVFGQ